MLLPEPNCKLYEVQQVKTEFEQDGEPGAGGNVVPWNGPQLI